MFIELFCLITKLFPFVITEETERLRAELTQVRTELEPWENQIIEHKGRLDVASAEKKLMKEKVGLLCTPPPSFLGNKKTAIKYFNSFWVLQLEIYDALITSKKIFDFLCAIIFAILTWAYQAWHWHCKLCLTKSTYPFSLFEKHQFDIFFFNFVHCIWT